MLASASFWTQPLPSNAPIDSESSTWVASVAAGIKNLNFLYRNSGIPIFWATENTPRQKVWVDAKDSNLSKLRAALTSVPIPNNFRPPGPWPGDNEAIICLRKADNSVEYFEFHGMREIGVDGARTVEEIPNCTTLTEPGWHCTAATAVKDLNKNPGYLTQGDWPGGVDIGAKENIVWGTSASKTISYYHTIKVAEAQKFYIPHALRFALPRSLHRTDFRLPALASDGESTNPAHPPTGCVFRFKATETFVDVSNPFVKAVCRAIRDYGAILTDSSGSEGNGAALKCQTEATVIGSQNSGTDAWKGVENKIGSPGAILTEGNEANPSNETALLGNQIPLGRLEILSTTYSPASVTAGTFPH